MQAPDSGRARGQRGAVTAELAVAMPALALLLVALLTAASAGITSLRVQEAARSAAREVQRGQPEQAVSGARRIAGQDAEVQLLQEGGWIQAQVTAELQAPLLRWLPVRLSASASVPAEPGTGP